MFLKMWFIDVYVTYMANCTSLLNFSYLCEYTTPRYLQLFKDGKMLNFTRSKQNGYEEGNFYPAIFFTSSALKQ